MIRPHLPYLNIRIWVLILVLGLSACQPAEPTANPTPPVSPTALPLPRLEVTRFPPTLIPSPAASAPAPANAPPTSTPLPTLSPTPDPYAGLSVPELAARTYGGGALEVAEILSENSSFTRSLIRYPSDGLSIYGFMNVPQGEGPFPVVIAIHGYIDPSIYGTLDYTTGYADALARAGFLVLHPNLRGYPPSDDGENQFRVGMAIDVLNLIALVRQQGGQPGPLAQADPQSIGLWGHSMGGGIATRVMVVSSDVRAVVLYGAMSGDERQNYERIYNYFSDQTRGLEELGAPAEVFERISPIHSLERVQAAVSIHHGQNDLEVPVAWSEDLCARLEALEKPVECFFYPGAGHTFQGESDQLLVQRVQDFFERTLKP